MTPPTLYYAQAVRNGRAHAYPGRRRPDGAVSPVHLPALCGRPWTGYELPPGAYCSAVLCRSCRANRDRRP